ncbi:MAG: LppP/LprE family lipoprotein [Mycobacteriaceae bacterium]
MFTKATQKDTLFLRFKHPWRQLLPTVFTLLFPLLALSACYSSSSESEQNANATTPISSSAPPSTPAGNNLVETPRSGTVSASPSAKSDNPCAIDLTAPAVIDAIKKLPTEDRSPTGWNLNPIAGNYNPCATLSTAIVATNNAKPGSPTKALMFHKGQYLSSGVADAYGYTGIDLSSTTDDVVALQFSISGCQGCGSGLISTVKYQWKGDRVIVIGNLTG